MTSEQDKSHNKLHAINFLNNKVLPCFLDCKNKKIIDDQAVVTYISKLTSQVQHLPTKRDINRS